MTNRLRLWLAQAPPMAFAAFAGAAGFCTYFSMYAFRKPFTVGTFEHVDGWTFVLDYKIALVTAQVAGYALSKLIGVKLISEIEPRQRSAAILGLIGVSWVALVLFALTPAPWNVAFLFLNGLPLGLIWGLVFGFMEGRRTSEALGAVLCASFILSSGVVKSVGKWMMVDLDVPQVWMPAAVGALFVPVLLVSVLALAQLPPPDAQDQAERTRRQPMDARARRAFLAVYGPGVAALVGSYVMLTALRDFRDNFAAEIWAALGYGDAASVFTASETPVAVISLAALGAMMVIKDNRKAVLAMHLAILAGFLLLGGATLAFQAHLISPLAWMIATGAGLYIAYTPFNAMLFDRLIAYAGTAGTAGFLIYIGDASGYLGSTALLIFRNFFAVRLDWLQFFIACTYLTTVAGVILVGLAGLFFLRHRHSAPAAAPPETVAAE